MHHHDLLRRVALAVLIAQAQAPRGWDTERSARLQSYRAAPAPLVAAAAQFTLPPDEAAQPRTMAWVML